MLPCNPEISGLYNLANLWIAGGAELCAGERKKGKSKSASFACGNPEIASVCHLNQPQTMVTRMLDRNIAIHMNSGIAF